MRESEARAVSENAAIEEDFFRVGDLGDEPAAVLEALRTRLLDLTLTNRVLNFRPGGPRVVRVIDELPDQLFARLRARAELELLPVPAPTETHPLHARVQGPAGKKDRRTAAETYAQELGFDVSYELPRSTGGSGAPDRHQDDAIQTLLFPNDLEAELRTLHAEARSAIEEKGSNILYLVFGLLEWYERDDSNKKIHSPLVMLPVSLRRGDPDRKTGAYRFYLSYTDEDVLSNISLQEKLRRDYKLVLPEIGDDETPEEYADRVAKEVPLLPRWRICREVALGLLSFTKLFMFRDLDPSLWPKGATPLEHPLLLSLFGGTGAGHEYAPEYDFEGGDRGATPNQVPPIIMDADSSQHSAIVDAMQGRSLVIEGPPGTGKSQTIANLVASALADGKSVLFVADKLTALQVVSKRLDATGLGMFCLELHSDRTQKSRLMDDIRKRRDVRGKLRPPAELEERIEVLQSTRADLNAYAQRMNTPFGAMRWTIHDILWGTQRRRSRLGGDGKPWSEIVLGGVEQLTLDRYEALRRAARTFSQLLGEVRPAGARLEQHPFHGMQPRDLRHDTEEHIVRALEALARSASAAGEHMRTLSAYLGESIPAEAPAFSAWAGRVHLLSQLSQSANMAGVSHLGDSEARQALLEWCSRVRDLTERRTNLDARIPVPLARQLLLESGAALEAFTRGTRIGDLTGALQAIEEVNGLLAGSEGVLDGFAAWLGMPGLPHTVEAVSMVSDLLTVIGSVSPDILLFRAPSTDEAELVLDAAAKRASELREERARLNEVFQLDLLPEDPTLLEAHASTCATAGFFSFLSGAFRAAQRLFVLLSRQTQGASKRTMAEGFKALGAYRRKLDAFCNDIELRQLLGPGFRGLETDFDAIEAARQWQMQVHGIARRYRVLAPTLDTIATASRDRLGELDDLAAKCPPGLTELSRRLRPMFDMRVTKYGAGLSINEALAHLSETAGHANVVLSSARALGAGPTMDLGSLQGLRAEIESLARLESELATATLPRDVLGATYVFPNVPVTIAEQTVQYAEQLWARETPTAVRRVLLERPDNHQLERLHEFLVRGKVLIHAVEANEQALIAAGSIRVEEWYGGPGPRTLDVISSRVERALSERHTLSPWLAYLRARLALSQLGGDQLLEIAERDPDVDISRLEVAAELLVYGSLARRVFDAHPDLQRHEGFAHTNIREKFREYDIEIMRLQREQLAACIDQRKVPEGVKGASVKNRTELALLEHELGKQRMHIPIRQLVNRAGGALRALMPCFMMSPRSVAQYLSPGAHQFDLVIMDEASQLRPEDAMGALIRGKQAVIVGDSRQLPPTSFFSAASTDDGDDEEFIVETKESILDLAKTAFKPVRQLRWHYRSRHGSLIAFSNREYYDNNLVVFPSPSDRSDDLGVKYIEVAEGTCVGGLNEGEADRVVDAVLEHLRTRPFESFGVVTMNVKQKQRIEVRLGDRLKDQPELRKVFDSGVGGEPAFIKNLESVQGDERDVIFISVTYGPTTPGGRVPRTFGPLNQASGWRRLNVLFTRAKKRVVVFSSFAPEALEGGELSRGASDLKKYLTFARSGFYLPAETTDRAPDSDFEEEVAGALRDAGYCVVPQVGVAGYFIDLAVKHPLRTTEFILGVECDGAAYHSSFSARDRDRLRQQVLEGLGWKIHRIWSTDWYRDPVGQRRRLVEAVQALS